MTRTFALLAGILLFAYVAFAQLDSNSVTITATRNASAVPDQVMFSISVESPADATLDQVTGAFHSAITAATLESLNTIPSYDQTGRVNGSRLYWTFGYTAPLASLTATFGALASAQENLMQQNSPLQMSFNAQGSQPSPVPSAQACGIPDLIADARARTQAFASAAGLNLGAILAIADATTASPVASAAWFNVPTLAFRTGDFVSVGVVTGFARFSLSSPPPTCTLQVKFALTR